jgi:hypothetical protein
MLPSELAMILRELQLIRELLERIAGGSGGTRG